MADVTPLVGVWIEILITFFVCCKLVSLPLWECGLKYVLVAQIHFLLTSLPLWECGLKYCKNKDCLKILLSLPLWECGLKSLGWLANSSHPRHSPCGSVD